MLVVEGCACWRGVQDGTAYCTQLDGKEGCPATDSNMLLVNRGVAVNGLELIIKGGLMAVV